MVQQKGVLLLKRVDFVFEIGLMKILLKDDSLPEFHTPLVWIWAETISGRKTMCTVITGNALKSSSVQQNRKWQAVG